MNGDNRFKGERTISDTDDFIETGFLGIESANKLQVLYLFENQLYFTDSFKDTMRIINENDGAWKNYVEILDKISELDEPQNNPLSTMAAALVHMHLARLEILFEEDDWLDTIDMVYAFFQTFWDDGMRKLTRERHTWVKMFGVNS